MIIPTALVISVLGLSATAALAGEPPEAACCLGNTCQMLTEEVCTSMGGTWVAGETCDTITCSDPGVGACCFMGTECIMVPEAHCAS